MDGLTMGLVGLGGAKVMNECSDSLDVILIPAGRCSEGCLFWLGSNISRETRLSFSESFVACDGAPPPGVKSDRSLARLGHGTIAIDFSPCSSARGHPKTPFR